MQNMEEKTKEKEKEDGKDRSDEHMQKSHEKLNQPFLSKP